MRLLMISFISLIPMISFAEYRVYQYQVRSRFPGEYQTKPHVVTSSLDPVSYLSYHGGETSIQVDMMRSWTCKGHTGGMQEVCAGPLERSIASEKNVKTAEVNN